MAPSFWSGSGSSHDAEAASWLLPEPDQKDGVIVGATGGDAFFADSDHYLDLDFARSMDDIKAISVQLNGQPDLDLNGGNKIFYSDHSMNHSVRMPLYSVR